MKTILSMLVIASLFITSCTRQSNGADDLIPHQQGIENNPNGGGGDIAVSVPAAVLSAFNARYPDAIKIQWKNLSNGNYKAEFFRGTVKWQAIFTPSGSLVKEENV